MEATVAGCIAIAGETEVFRDDELEVLRGVLEDYFYSPDRNYRALFEERDGRIVAFVIYGRTPMTATAWDLYWIVVDRNYQGKGIGKKLVRDLQTDILRIHPGGILRVETSAKNVFAVACGFYRKNGFTSAGRIPNFYGVDDDLVIFYKTL